VRYRKKPVEIEARQFNGSKFTEALEMAEWCSGEVEIVEGVSNDKRYVVAIPTLEGTMFASAGDYIIKGVRGEFYPCKPGIFEETYEACDDQ
jgi:hypothetical protein